MPNTALGTPYVSASDLVAGYPTVSLNLANKVDTKADYAIPPNAQTGTSYTFVLADGLKLTTASNASPVTLTIPPQSSVIWPDSTILRVVNYGAGVVTIAGGVGVTVTNATTTLKQYQSANLIRTASNAWTLVPFSGGVDNANFSNTATGTYSSGGKNYKYVTFDTAGTLTITATGLARILVIGGGARGDGVNTGTGGNTFDGYFFIPATSYAISIGAGGAASNTPGGQTSVGTFIGANGGRALNVGAGAWLGGAATAGVPSDATGTSVTYGRSLATAANRGDGGANNSIAGRVVAVVEV